MSVYEPEKYLPTIDAILSVANLEEITVKKIRKALQELFGVDLNPHKKEINEVILNRYYNLQSIRKQESENAEKRDRDEMERQDALLAAKLSRQESGGRQPRTKRKATKASPSKEKTKRTPNNAFNREMALSHELQNVIAQERCSRPQVVKHLWAYIKDNNLQNPADKRQILCDDRLQKLFKKKSVGAFEMNRILSKHIFVPDEIDNNSSAQDEVVVDEEEKSDETTNNAGSEESGFVVDNNTDVNLEKTAKQLEEELTSEEE